MQVDDLRALEDSAEMSAIVSTVEQPSVHLSDAEIAALTAFLNSLTDPKAMIGRLGVPDTVPSGLKVPN